MKEIADTENSRHGKRTRRSQLRSVRQCPNTNLFSIMQFNVTECCPKTTVESPLACLEGSFGKRCTTFYQKKAAGHLFPAARDKVVLAEGAIAL